MTRRSCAKPLLPLALLAVASWATAQSRRAEHWVGTWAAAQQAVYPAIAPPAPGLADVTLRQVVRTTVGGRRVRIRLSNEFGKSALAIRAARVAVSAGRAAIRAGTDRGLTFSGRPGVAVPAGAAYWSDPVDVDIPAGGDLAVTLRTGDVIEGQVTEHSGARCTSYVVPGDAESAIDLPNAVTSEHWYFLSGVDVDAGDNAADHADSKSMAVVVLGDSITDGRGSTTNENGRWPDSLARRLQADVRTKHVAVLNGGIGGNRVLSDGLGPSALARFDRDVLAQTAAEWVIVLEGVNDLGTAKPADAAATADRLIEAYRQMIVRAHARGMRIVGGTITPFAGSQYDMPEREAARQTVNAFVRGGAFDAAADFDAAVRDPDRPSALLAAYDSNDHLHLNDRGYRAMADAVNIDRFAE